MNSTSTEIVLSYDGLDVSYGGARAVHGFSLDVARGQIVGLVGESGSGKSTVLKAAVGLLGGAGRIDSGSILFEGHDLAKASKRELVQVRGAGLSYVFQNPHASLDPLFTIGNQFDECLLAHRKATREELRGLETELLAKMGFDDPERVLSLYPHNLSGGMCQRVVLAIALATDCQVLLADEPTSALDVTSQAQVIELLRSIREAQGTSILIVSHNMGVIAEIADTVGVMYRGHLVEFGTRDQVFGNPLHPYTRDLIAAIPKYDGTLPQASARRDYGKLERTLLHD